MWFTCVNLSHNSQLTTQELKMVGQEKDWTKRGFIEVKTMVLWESAKIYGFISNSPLASLKIII